MGMSYSIEIRRHALSLREKERLSFKETGQRLGIGMATIQRWAKRIEPKRGFTRSTRKIDPEKLKEDVEKYPDAYQYERAARFKVSATSIRKALRKLGITHKKKR